MTRNEDFPGFALAIGKMFLSYGRDVTDLALDAYWDDLCHLTLAQVTGALPEAKRLAERGFPPDAEGIRRCAEKQPAAPYHARLALAPFEPKEEWPDLPEGSDRAAKVAALCREVALRKSIQKAANASATEALARHQWPGYAAKGDR